MIIHVLMRRDTSRDPRDAGAYNDTVVGHCDDAAALKAVAAVLTTRATGSAARYHAARDRAFAAYWAELPDDADHSTGNPRHVALWKHVRAEAEKAGREDTAAIGMVDAGYRALMDVTYHVVERDVGPAIVITGHASDDDAS